LKHVIKSAHKKHAAAELLFGFEKLAVEPAQ
jgi:hypothetical protein